jgi:hypothetical protein
VIASVTVERALERYTLVLASIHWPHFVNEHVARAGSPH